MKENKKKEYVFGPVPSRRLGRSLGIDLVPFKTCSYDCLYCQVGFTTEKTIQRKKFVPLDEILTELAGKLPCKPDYITLSGSGEPTLYSQCGELIRRIKETTNTPVAVITNGSTLAMADVRAELSRADLVVPSLDAGDQETFQRINRPCSDIKFDEMLDGLVKFRDEYSGQYWLEVFFIAGINDSEEQVSKIADCIKKIRPDKVQINTVSRPPADSSVQAVPKSRLEEIAGVIHENAEVIADYNKIENEARGHRQSSDVFEMIKRRPCSVEDISAGLGINRLEVLKYIEMLVDEKKIETYWYNDRNFYKAISVD